MENTKICDLCLAEILDYDFEKLDMDKVENLKILNIHITLNNNPIICTKCAGNIQQSYNFKSLCLSNNEYLKTLLYPGDTTHLNLQEIFVKKLKREVENEDKKVCRFCLQSFEVNLLVEPENKEQNPFLKDMLDRCLPEMDLCMTETVLMCNECMDLLENQFKFISNCQDNELLKNLKKENFDVDIKTEDCITNFENIEEPRFQIKANECLDCNDERKETGIDRDISCNLQFPYKAYGQIELDSQYVQSVANSKQYKCDKCSFITKWRQSLHRHYIHHKPPSEINMYKCTYCPNKFKFKWHFLAHSRRHMSEENLEKDKEVRKLQKENGKNGTPTIFICAEEECSFKTNQKVVLDIHMKKHKDYDEIDTYITKQYKGDKPNDTQEEPSTTSYWDLMHRSKEEGKNCLKNYPITQENDGAKNKCTKCPFQTKFKMSFVSHSQKHLNDKESAIQKDTSSLKLKTVQCTICGHRTGSVHNLKQHYTLKHKYDAVHDFYSCVECDYKTKCKFELKSHERIHKPTYKCEKCNYVTKTKQQFQNHAKVHMELSEVETFACHLCAFVTKFKKNIIVHVKRHQAVANAITTN